MFGGSTTWGEGQRDEYTIASDLARLGETAGTPVIVRNFGQRGWAHFQEMILFEQLLAAEPAPDIVLFYDGANEINVQALGAKGVPSHTMVDAYAKLLSGGLPAEFTPAPEEPDPVRTAWESYVRHSAVHKLARGLDDLFSDDAGASVVTPVERRQVSDYQKTIDDARRALDVYERGRSLSQFLATEHHVRPMYFWQPVVAGRRSKSGRTPASAARRSTSATRSSSTTTCTSTVGTPTSWALRSSPTASGSRWVRSSPT